MHFGAKVSQYLLAEIDKSSPGGNLQIDCAAVKLVAWPGHVYVCDASRAEIGEFTLVK